MPVAAIGAAVGTAVLGGDRLAQPLVLLAVMLAPILLPQRILYPPERKSPPPGSDGDDGGGRGPRPDPPARPDAPRGGIPLPDAEPARVRFRDHGRPTLAPPRPRRPAHEPERVPQRERTARGVKRSATG